MIKLKTLTNQDKERLSKTLSQVTEQTFETLAFMFSMGEDELDETPGETAVAACLEFSGPCSGVFVVAVSRDMLIPLGANMLGIMDVDPTETEQRDALKELTNVICGNVLPAIAGEEAVFDVHPPHLVFGKLPNDAQPTVSSELCLDEGRAEVALFFEGDAPSQDIETFANTTG